MSELAVEHRLNTINSRADALQLLDHLKMGVTEDELSAHVQALLTYELEQIFAISAITSDAISLRAQLINILHFKRWIDIDEALAAIVDAEQLN